MTEEPRRAPYRQGADPLDRLTAILIAAVTIVAATAAFLQTDASNHASVANRDAQNYSLEALGLRTAGQAEVDYGWYAATHTWFELDTLVRTAEQDGNNPAAKRYRDVRDRITNLSPLLQSPYFDREGSSYPDLSGYETDRFLVEATELSEQNTNAARLSNDWDGRANNYILHLTLLAVALALLGLSATRATWTRKLFVTAGSLIVLVTVCWMAVVAIGDIEETPDEAMDAFARGYGLAWRYQPQEAIEEFDEALAADPSYANAYYERGNAHLNLAFGDAGLDPEAAQDELTNGAEDLESARGAGKNDKNVNWNLGFVYYLTGDFEKAIAADERALEEDPTLFPVACNLGLTHLAAGDIEEAREQYAAALATVIDEVTVAKRADREPPSSLWLYLDLCASDLDSLRARLALDPRPWTQAPLRDAISDSDDLRREVDRLLVEIKDHLVALEYTGEPPGAPTTAETAPFQFGVARTDANGDPVVDRHGLPFFDPDPDATFPSGTDEVNVLFDYEDTVDGQKEAWKIYIDGEEEPALRIHADWSLGATGSAVLPISYTFSNAFVLQSGEYSVELYLDHRLVRRGGFTIE